MTTRAISAKISVVMPCFDHGAFVDEAVTSCLSQGYDPLEIIIVNDGSTDQATNDFLRDYSRPKTRVVHIENRGLGGARNEGIRHATGKYLCFLDADDRLHPTYFEKAVGLLEKNSELTFVSCWIEAFGSEQWTYRPERCDLPTLLAECTVATPAIVRREAVLSIGCFDPAMPVQGYEDWDLWIHLLAQGGRGAILPEILFAYRRQPGSMVERCYYSDAHLVLMRYLFEKYASNYQKHMDYVLAHQAAEILELERNQVRLERQLKDHLLPSVAERRHRLSELEGKRARAREVETLRSELDSATNEVAALRASRSWRITAPLRAAYRLLLTMFKGRGAS